MFSRESDAVSPRLGDTNLVSSERTFNGLHALHCESVYGIGCSGGGKVSLGVCNSHACQKVAWRSDSRLNRIARANVRDSQSWRHGVLRSYGGNISNVAIVRTILRTEGIITTLKVVAVATAVAQGVRTR